MLLGVPVVSTRVDGFVELVGDSEGALMVDSWRPEEARGGDLVAEVRSGFAPAAGGAGTSADCREFRNVRLRLELGAVIRSSKLAGGELVDRIKRFDPCRQAATYWNR